MLNVNFSKTVKFSIKFLSYRLFFKSKLETTFNATQLLSLIKKLHKETKKNFNIIRNNSIELLVYKNSEVIMQKVEKCLKQK